MNPQVPPQPPASYGDGRIGDLAAVLEKAAATSARVRENGGPDGIAAALDSLLMALEELQIPAVLVGGLALRQHVGIRNTEDIDLILDPGDLSRVAGLEVLERNEWFAAARLGPLPVVLLFTSNPLFAMVARDYAEPRPLGRRQFLCATPFGLVLLKLFALPWLYRQGNIGLADLCENDLLMLLRNFPCDKSRLLDILAPYLSASDIKALGQVLDDIGHRLRNPPGFV